MVAKNKPPAPKLSDADLETSSIHNDKYDEATDEFDDYSAISEYGPEEGIRSYQTNLDATNGGHFMDINKFSSHKISRERRSLFSNNSY